MRKFRGAWVIAGITALFLALPAAFLYPRALNRYTWVHPSEKPVQLIRGLDTDFTAKVKDFIKENPDQNTPEELIRTFNLDEIWTAESLNTASAKLLALYSRLVLSLAIGHI